jgi:hypothetical protein
MLERGDASVRLTVSLEGVMTDVRQAEDIDTAMKLGAGMFSFSSSKWTCSNQ